MVDYDKERKTRICFVSGSYPKYRIGGAELQNFYLAKKFVRSGWEVHFTCTHLGNTKSNLILDEGMKIHKFKYRRFFDILYFFEISISLFISTYSLTTSTILSIFLIS